MPPKQTRARVKQDGLHVTGEDLNQSDPSLKPNNVELEGEICDADVDGLDSDHTSHVVHKRKQQVAETGSGELRDSASTCFPPLQQPLSSMLIDHALSHVPPDLAEVHAVASSSSVGSGTIRPGRKDRPPQHSQASQVMQATLLPFAGGSVHSGYDRDVELDVIQSSTPQLPNSSDCSRSLLKNQRPHVPQEKVGQGSNFASVTPGMLVPNKFA